MKLSKAKMKRRYAYYLEHFSADKAERKSYRDARLKREKRSAERKVMMAAQQRMQAQKG